jgi:threonyl-tRNA synthetase
MSQSHPNEDLQNKRHSLAHLLAKSVRELYPGAQNAIGPAIDNGFYQDFDLPESISDEDLPKIEKKMREILKTWTTAERKEVSVEEAKQEFAWNPYKLELIEEFAKDGSTITFYTLGDFLDLCKGGHAEDASAIDPQSFKLTKVAGAYWKGDEKNKMLTRVYGVAFETKPELDAYLAMLEEAKKRDHKKLGVQLDLFTFSDLVGAGLPLWTPQGTLVRNLLSDFVWQLRKERGYEKVEIPHITKKELYEISGHWGKFKDELFIINSREGHEFAMKPMNCPHHTQIYSHLQRSYRDLPIRYESTTMCYRDEQTGELSGLQRLRSFTQDDAHVFCRYDQVKEEFMKVWDIIEAFYGMAGFVLTPELSFSDPAQQEKYLGTREVWEKAERQLLEIAQERGVKAEVILGEAAFYGPKIDFIAKDSIGRELQVATIQLDMSMPESFDLTCINEEGTAERIVMIHAAIMGSIERFLSVYIEHTAGNFPLWLHPTQVALLPISDKHLEYAAQVKKKLAASIPDLRVSTDDRAESVGKKIREASIKKTPYLCVIGDKEIEAGGVAVRGRGELDLGTISVEEFMERLKDEIENKK